MVGWTMLILGGTLLAWFVRNDSCLLMWTTLVQLIFTVYLSIAMGPAITDWITGGTTDGYYDAATVLLLAITLFLVAHLVTKRTMPRIEKLALPHPAESVGSIFLGFCCGVLATSFLLAVLWFTPLSRTLLVERLSGGQRLERTALRPVRVVCKGVGYLSFQSDPWAARNILQRLVTRRHPTHTTSNRVR